MSRENKELKGQDRRDAISKSFHDKDAPSLYEKVKSAMFGKETKEEKKARLKEEKKEEARRKLEKERRDKFKNHKVKVK